MEQNENAPTMDEALNDLMNDDGVEPEIDEDTDDFDLLDVSGDEDDGAEPDDEELQEPDYLEIDDTDFDTKYKYGDDVVTLRDLYDARERAAQADALEQERAELERRAAEIDERAADKDYVQYEDIPHKFLTASLQPMVKKGLLPESLYAEVAEAFNRAIENGSYDPNGVESLAEIAAQKRQIEAERQSIEQERQRENTTREIAAVQQKHGIDLSKDKAAAEKLLAHIKDVYKRTSKMPTLQEAADALAAKGAFKQPPATRRSLREKHTAKKKPRPQAISKDITYDQALKNLMEI